MKAEIKQLQLSDHQRQRLIELYQTGKRNCEISRQLNIQPSTVSRFLRHFRETNSISRKPYPGRPTKLSLEILAQVNEILEQNDEANALQISYRLNDSGHIISHAGINRARSVLGWTFQRTRYGHSIRAQNVVLRKSYAKMMIRRMQAGYDFDDTFYADESKIQLNPYALKTFHRRNHPRKYHPVNKHPISVLVWAAISKRGGAKLFIFNGMMNGRFYTHILRKALLPAARKLYPNGNWKFYQDNDPKHTCQVAKQFYELEGIEWTRSPAESPDMNPIENLWAELKAFLRRKVKPRNLDDLVKGIKRFWNKCVTPIKCKRYINHLRTVIPAVYAAEGKMSGY